MVDSHSHIYLPQFDRDRDAVIQRALDAGVKKILLPNIDKDTVDEVFGMQADYGDICYGMIGLHPCSVDGSGLQQAKFVEEGLANRNAIAIGEIGTDLYWDKTYRDEQIALFKWQIALAREHDLPVVIHSRETLDLNIEIVESMQDGRLKGVFHCFTGTVEQARRIQGAGFVMGFGGIVTFKNANLDPVLKQVAPECMILETDAPYLAPVPFRGKRNESAYVRHVAEYMAGVLEVGLEVLAEQTTNNVQGLFKISV